MLIAILHTNANYLTGLRLPLMKDLRNRGCDVIAIAPNISEIHENILSAHGIRSLRCQIDATGFNPVRDIYNCVGLTKLLRSVRPDVILTNTAKAVIYGSLCAYIAGVGKRFALISGLGYAYTDDGKKANARKLIARLMLSILYSIALRLNKSVIFQNSDDREFLTRKKICPKDIAEVVAGSGVDVKEYSYAQREILRPVFIMVSRLLIEKGVHNYIEAAIETSKHLPDAKFFLIGDYDNNPSSLTREQMKSEDFEGKIDWVSGVRDVRPWLYKANIFVLPSYREGLPRSTLEAMSTGLPVITTNVPGCRETVEDGVNGILVPVRNSEMLASAMINLGGDLNRAVEMGKASRGVIMKKFDSEIVNDQMCQIMGLTAFVHSELAI
jgi:glycosyltransferase involved in cell wall biosynthesis